MYIPTNPDPVSNLGMFTSDIDIQTYKQQLNDWLTAHKEPQPPAPQGYLRLNFADKIFAEIDSGAIRNVVEIKRWITEIAPQEFSALLDPSIYDKDPQLTQKDLQSFFDQIGLERTAPAPNPPIPPIPTGTKIRVETFNIRTSDARDPGKLNWDQRKQAVIDEILGNASDDTGQTVGATDFIGLQETSDQQNAEIMNGIQSRGYGEVLTFPGGGKEDTIIYDKKKWTAVGSGTIPLQGDQWQRAAGFAVFKNAEGKTVIVCNTHACVGGITDADCQTINAKLRILQQQYPSASIVNMGDYNSHGTIDGTQKQNDLVKDTGMQNAFDPTNGQHRDWDSAYTFNGWNPGGTEKDDYIYASNVDWSQSRTRILHNKGGIDGVPFASDHWAVVADLTLQG